MITEYDGIIDKLYDKDGKPIDFDYKKYARITERINNKDPRSDELRKMITRTSFPHIPNGVYYFLYKGKAMVPHVVFREFDMLIIGNLVKSDKEKDNYAYYFVFSPVCHYKDAVIAFYDNYHYGIGLDTKRARENLELKIFDKYRNKFLQIASKAKEKAK